MPYVLRPPIRRVRLGLALAVIVLSAFAFPALASAACPVQPTSQVFAPYGDNENYSLVPGGDFELPTASWALKRAGLETEDSLKPGDAPHLLGRVVRDVNGNIKDVVDLESLRIDDKGLAVSPAVCVSVRHPTFRFFAFRAGGSSGDLDVRLRWTDDEGEAHDNRVASLDGSSFEDNWQLSPRLPLGRALPLEGEETAQVNLVFDFGAKSRGKSSPKGKGSPKAKGLDRAFGHWMIDEVYVDPYRR